jgi:hypothetical protein
MGVAIEAVDPRGHAAEAAAVLQAAWGPPRLRYAPEDLAWQFARPGWAGPRGWIARDAGGAPVAFAAALPRTVRFAGATREVWLASFYAAAPGPPAAPLALLRAEVRDLKATGRPTVVFAAPGSAGEAALRANDAAGYRRNPLAVARTHAGVGAADGPAGLEVREAAPGDGPDVLAVARAVPGDRLIADHPDPAALAHDPLDPRGRCWAVVRDAGGAAVAAACVGVNESVTAAGPARLAALWAVALTPAAGADGLAALVGFAARRWAGRTTSPVVTLPNPTGIPPGVLRGARLRALPVAWAPYVFCPDPADPLLTATGTTVEII